MYYAVIVAGGSGTRLWPLSRQHHPKQALKLVGERTMFQYAVERIAPIFPAERVFVVTREAHAPILMEQAPQLPEENFILEPEGRGTAPAIGLAAAHLSARDPDAIMAILTADHFISATDEFCQVLSAVEQIAAQGSLVTLGITPSSASTGFGYIHKGAAQGEQNGNTYFAVRRFTEKPDPNTAQEMVASGDYSWNSGMFIWRVADILAEFQRQMPDFHAQLQQVSAAIDTLDYEQVLLRVWPKVKKETIDYGIMEGAKRVVVIPVDIGWTDVGSWGSMFDLLPIDEHANVSVGEHLSVDTHRTLVYADKRLVATLGVEDLVIIDSEDALLVCSRQREQDVKLLVETLQMEQKGQLT